MTAPIRIRTASGDEIDLAEVRAYLSEQLAWKQVTLATNLLDALEAALGVSDKHKLGGPFAEARGYSHALRDVRQAAGVVEEVA